MADLLYCYNKGCGNKYKPEDNKEGLLAFCFILSVSFFKPGMLSVCAMHMFGLVKNRKNRN